MLNRIFLAGYIAAFVIMLLGALFFRQTILTSVVLFMILFPVVSIKLVGKTKDRLLINIGSLPETAETGELVRLDVSVQNPTPVPMLNCCLYMDYRNVLQGPGKSAEIIFPAAAKDSWDYVADFKVSVPGLLEFNVSELKVTDFLHIRSFSIPIGIKRSIMILPELKGTFRLPLKKSAVLSEAFISSSGEITTEVKQFRDYIPGDRLKDINWKQTARTGELTVREYERTKEEFYVLMPVLTGGAFKNCLERYYDLACGLLKKGEIFYTAVYDSSIKAADLLPAESEEDLVRILYRLFEGCVSFGGQESYKDRMLRDLENILEDVSGITVIEDEI